MKVILAFDSFKGSLSAEEAVNAAAKGILNAMPDAEIVRLPLADGGEGTTEALCRYTNAKWHSCSVHDALMREIVARYAISQDGTTAIIDMASAAGLTLIEESKRNPMFTTTFGVGEMMLDAISKGCRNILLGIGGSATNDGGIGMLSALGARFLDKYGNELQPIGKNLCEIANIDLKNLILNSKYKKSENISVICDVDNPLYGQKGAALVYASQKGASAEEISFLDNGLKQLASLCEADPETPGAGAAGGLGYGLLLLGARLRKGVEVILEASHFDQHLEDADLVITGEGKSDSQTLNGKLPYGILQRVQKTNVPVVILAGIVEDKCKLLSAGFLDARSINPPLNSEQDIIDAMNPENASRNLAKASETILNIYHHA